MLKVLTNQLDLFKLISNLESSTYLLLLRVQLIERWQHLINHISSLKLCKLLTKRYTTKYRTIDKSRTKRSEKWMNNYSKTSKE